MEILSGKNKIAVLFSLLGPEISANVISKLSIEDAQRVRNEVLANINDVQRPQRLDDFVDELLHDTAPKHFFNSSEAADSVVLSRKAAAAAAIVAPILPSIPKITDFTTLDDHEIFQQISLEMFEKLIMQEPKHIQRFALHVLPDTRMAEAKAYFKDKGLFDPSAFDPVKTPYLSSVQEKIRVHLLSKLRLQPA